MRSKNRKVAWYGHRFTEYRMRSKNRRVSWSDHHSWENNWLWSKYMRDILLNIRKLPFSSTFANSARQCIINSFFIHKFSLIINFSLIIYSMSIFFFHYLPSTFLRMGVQGTSKCILFSTFLASQHSILIMLSVMLCQVFFIFESLWANCTFIFNYLMPVYCWMISSGVS